MHPATCSAVMSCKLQESHEKPSTPTIWLGQICIRSNYRNDCMLNNKQNSELEMQIIPVSRKEQKRNKRKID